VRIAVIGAHPVALEAVRMWQSEGAQVDWFIHQDLSCPMWQSALTHFPDMPYDQQTIAHYNQEVFQPFLNKMLQEGRAKNNKVLAISKTFLAKDETPKDKTRMLDTFRVVYEVIPSGDIGLDAQGQQLPSSLMQHLTRAYERFIDVDLVIDCRGHKQTPMHAGPSGNDAIGERYIHKNIHYGFPTQESHQTVSNASGALMIVGSGATAAHWINLLDQDLFKKEVYLVTQELYPFADLKQEYEFGFLRQKLDDVFRRLQTERSGKFKFYLGHNVMGIDELHDQEELYVTLDRPHFRQNGQAMADELKTLRVSQVIVATGFLPNLGIYQGTRLELPLSKTQGPLGPEAGLYSLDLGNYGAQNHVQDFYRHQLESVKQDVKRFFSKN
jgi:hypothetical protein